MRRLLALSLCLILLSGCVVPAPGPGPVVPPSPAPAPLPGPGPGPTPQPVVANEAAVWEWLAVWVETQPDRVRQSDRVLAIAKDLKATGALSDLSRLSRFEAASTEITDSNRSQVVATIRGR